jgi:hypothetical protein
VAKQKINIFPIKKSVTWLFFVVLFQLFPTTIYLFSQNSSITDEYTLKAVYFEKFTLFTEWPKNNTNENPRNTFVIGVIGGNPFGKKLEELYHKQKINNMKVEIQHLSSIKEIKCQNILFIYDLDPSEIQKLVMVTKQKPILTISETEGYSEKGVLINFFIQQGKLRFEINENAVKESGLKIDSRLLNFARIINPINN